MSRSRNYCFTLNNYSDVDFLHSIKCRYLIAGREVGENGTPHLQGFISFENAKSFAVVKKLLPGAHIEKANTIRAAIEYCRKEDPEPIEFGTPPLTPAEKGTLEKRRWNDALSAAKEGRIDDIDADILLRHYGTIKRIRTDYQKALPSLDDIADRFCWYYGASGTGKSSKAREDNPDYYLKRKNKWWDGYRPGQPVIIEEWGLKDGEYLGDMLKEWCDHHSFAAEVKNGYTNLRPPKIIITSNYSMEQCFPDIQGHLIPLQRRIKAVHFKQAFW